MKTPERALVGALALLLTGGATSASAQTNAPIASPAAAPMASKVPGAAPMASAMPAPNAMVNPMPALKLSDTIRLSNGLCWIVSDATDREQPRDPVQARRCRFIDSANALTRVLVPGAPDESILFQYKILPDGTIVGGACREGVGPAAYSCKVTGKTKPGTQPGMLLTAGGTIQVWEPPNAP